MCGHLFPAIVICGTNNALSVLRGALGTKLLVTYRLVDSGCSSNIETPLRAKYLSGQRSMAKN